MVVAREPTAFIGGSLGEASFADGKQIADAPPFIAGGLVVTSIEFEVPVAQSDDT